MHLTDRDIDVLAFIGEHGIASRQHLQDRFWITAKHSRAVQRRLSKLGAESLVRIMEQSRPTGRRQGGALPFIYGLTPQGAEIVAERTGCWPKRILHADLSQTTLSHRLDLVELRLSWDHACATAGVEETEWLLDCDSESESNEIGPAHHRLLRYVFMDEDERIVYQPDAVSRTRLSVKGRSICIVLVWELDRSTEGHKQLQAKVRPLRHFLAEQAFRKHWPDIPRNSQNLVVRSMWTVKTDRRRRQMLRRFQNSGLDGYIRCAVLSEFCSSRSLSESLWQDVAGNSHAIYLPPGA